MNIKPINRRSLLLAILASAMTLGGCNSPSSVQQAEQSTQAEQNTNKTVLIFGATGRVGVSIVKEALSRGHNVIGVSRSPEKFSYAEENFTGVKGNPTDADSVKQLSQGVDAIISAVGGREATTPEETAMNKTAIAFSEALGELGNNGPQVVIIGGGMTMQGSPEAMIAAMPPNAGEGSPLRALFLGHWVAYETYQASNINWTFLAPPMNLKGFRPGADIRTGTYRTAIEEVVVNADGNSEISLSDLAVAAVDFAESGEFVKNKVTIGD